MRSVRVVLVSLMSAAALALAAAPASAVDDQVSDPALFGRVLTTSSVPVAGASVVVRDGTGAVGSTTTSGAGEYQIDVPDGAYAIEVSAPDASLSSVSTLAVQAPRDWPLDLVLSERTSGRVAITGDVNLSTGESATAGSALFAGAGTSISTSGFFSTSTTPGTAGSWSLSGVRASTSSGSLVLFASGGPHTTVLQDTYADVVVPMTSTVVRVVDPQGSPVAGALVRVNSGGYGLAESSSVLMAGARPFAVSWTATGSTNPSGLVTVARPLLEAPTAVTMMVDPPAGSLMPLSQVVQVPAVHGSLDALLQVRPPASGSNGGTSGTVVVAPSPPSPSSNPSSSPTPSPSSTGTATATPAAPLPVRVSGVVSMSDRTSAPGAIVIPMDPASRVNGGNSADGAGRYLATRPAGFTGNWLVSTRPQASLEVPDPLVFSLSGGDPYTWTQDTTIDFTIPVQLHRVRVVDQTGQPLVGVGVHAAVRADTDTTTARVGVLAGQAPMRGWWRGTDVTGDDGWAQVPAIVMANSPLVEVSFAPEASSRYEARMIRVAPTQLADTILVVGIKDPAVTAFTPTRATAGGQVTVTGTHLLGASAVTVNGTHVPFTVSSSTQLSLDLPSDATSGIIEVTTAGGTARSTQALSVLAPPLAITSSTLPAGQVARPYTATLAATGGTAPYRWQVIGNRPTGLTLTTQGTWQGTPARPLNQNLTIAVTDATGQRITRTLPLTIAPRPLTIPGAVTAVAGRGSDRRISLSWAAPSDDAGNPITGYRIDVTTDNGATWQLITANTRSRTTGTSFTYPVATPARFRVAALNATGIGPVTDKSISPILTAYGPPTAPASITVTPATGALNITWQAPAVDGGTPITGYRIRVSANNRTWSTVTSDTRTIATSTTLRLTAGRTYWIQVAAINTSGLSPYLTSASSASPR